ncbi:uncharacterized protein MELLADRAFT_92728 [Melampsora larici-populina 98AG31]|uniref:Uncharacterized protein n=1 Tax=Melampsora larici-populina (strain 98AG31 / pathotype 3-4-7) TaxID=747676 RepID=F4S2V8_MELLP|nr:uncharacterized protein MELLADRAFT_92728 [Melampsora larici-populina 98AG31]EGG01122.1 hypothetical protein MELLADRAFT_92728 [Melampsora larici-populina 98AG31]
MSQYAVYINTDQGFEGYNSGGRPDETISCGKMIMCLNIVISHLLLYINWCCL